jgi:hypothetical protein
MGFMLRVYFYIYNSLLCVLLSCLQNKGNFGHWQLTECDQRSYAAS